MVAQSGFCGVFRDVADEAPILLFATHNVIIGFVEPESPGDAHELVDFARRCAFNALQDPRKVMASQAIYTLAPRLSAIRSNSKKNIWKS